VYTISTTAIVNLVISAGWSKNFRGATDDSHAEQTPLTSGREKILMRKIENVLASIVLVLVAPGGNSKIH